MWDSDHSGSQPKHHTKSLFRVRSGHTLNNKFSISLLSSFAISNFLYPYCPLLLYLIFYILTVLFCIVFVVIFIILSIGLPLISSSLRLAPPLLCHFVTRKKFTLDFWLYPVFGLIIFIHFLCKEHLLVLYWIVKLSQINLIELFPTSFAVDIS